MTDSDPASRFDQLPEADRRTLRQRAREIARRVEEKELTDGIEVIELHSREQGFAIPLVSVLAITELGTVAAAPRAPPTVKGLVAVRGEVLIAVELAAMMGAGGQGFADLRRLVVISDATRRLAVLVERIDGVRVASNSSFHARGASRRPFVVGTDEKLVSLLDPAALISAVFDQFGGPR